MRKLYAYLTLCRSRTTLLLVTVLVTLLGTNVAQLRLDASSDSLLLQGDTELDFYREVRSRYGSDDFLIITYTPDAPLFSDAGLAQVGGLADALSDLAAVQDVLSLLDVPLVSLSTFKIAGTELVTLASAGVDITAARRELAESPLYRNSLVSADQRATALQVTLSPITAQAHGERQRALDQAISSVRGVMAEFSDTGQLFLGGVPMIVSDSIGYVRSDLATFGVGVSILLVLLLILFFRRIRWVLIALASCTLTTLAMLGLLGLFDWPVTVVSSNFVSLLLITTLSLSVHLIVRYRELCARHSTHSQQDLIRQTLSSKFKPCLYTAITTTVAFASLTFCDIQPVIDFGWMMVLGTCIAMIIVFTVFPAALARLSVESQTVTPDFTRRLTGGLASLVLKHPTTVLLVWMVIAVLAVLGLPRLDVQNRFIDYFKRDTEIYQGMELIDREFGGTTPFDIIVDAPPPEHDDDFLDADFPQDDVGIAGSSYWFNSFMLDNIAATHRYLEELEDVGKVLSLHTTAELLKTIQNTTELDDFGLSVAYTRLTPALRSALIEPYLSSDGNQIRLSGRVFESSTALDREQLIAEVQSSVARLTEVKPEGVRLTGMMVLYNNVLNSLFDSLVTSAAVVICAVFVMFAVVFRSLRVAAIAIVPNAISALFVLGLMGWLHIPLDIMTLTIASICIGIAVDDTIHYLHRFDDELGRSGSYEVALQRSHLGIGRAMYYTTVTITVGFSILMLSNFVPTVYFGLLTGASMLIALVADLTLLPLLVVRLKPFRA